jgi:hypothetical protein
MVGGPWLAPVPDRCLFVALLTCLAIASLVGGEAVEDAPARLAVTAPHHMAHPVKSDTMVINPRLFSVSTYLGPVVNLSYSDPAVLRVASVLRLGSLRYPGGSTANSWNITDGRWVEGRGGVYANRTDGLPRGTYTPKAFMEGIGGTLRAPPIWNLNLVSDPNPPAQIDTLKAQGVPVEFIELGNEDADEPLAPYLQNAAPLVARARQVFPNASISVIGCFGLPWKPCAASLKAAYTSTPRLFDAITIHQYAPTNATITAHAETDVERRCATLAAVGPSLVAMERKVATDLGPDVPIWLDEFNVLCFPLALAPSR